MKKQERKQPHNRHTLAKEKNWAKDRWAEKSRIGTRPTREETKPNRGIVVETQSNSSKDDKGVTETGNYGQGLAWNIWSKVSDPERRGLCSSMYQSMAKGQPDKGGSWLRFSAETSIGDQQRRLVCQLVTNKEGEEPKTETTSRGKTQWKSEESH